MTQTPYRFALMSGMTGYIPNSIATYEAHTRRELTGILRDELEYQGFPASRLKEFNIVRMWQEIQFAKSGSAVSSTAYHKQFVIECRGLTDDEFNAAIGMEE